MPDDFDWYLLAGDETALPAIGRRLEEVPAGARAVVVAEVADAAEEQSFATRADLQMHWLHRTAPNRAIRRLKNAQRAEAAGAGQ